MSLYRDHGIVLRTYKLGEADRIVVFVTERHGKVRAVAKGVRRTKSRFGARLEPTTHVALQLYEGRELDIVTQADTIDHFRSVRDDIDRFARASTLLEVVDQVAQEREPSPELYRMLLGGLRTLAGSGAPVIVGAFLWKLLALEGVQPIVEVCAACGGDGELVAFDLVQGGALCAGCRRGSPVSAEALSLLRQVLGGRLGEALNQPDGPAVVELDLLARRAIEQHLERQLRSTDVLPPSATFSRP
jgi:DNA repair protein RecO (recombination protein O)